MHLGLDSLLKFYRAHREDDSLVLGTIISTEGSTYRKAGAMMLIALDGSYRGLISGGCLEADLAQHAKSVFAENRARIISYDLAAGDDQIWGLGIGCEGVIRLLLQRVDRDQGFGFLTALNQVWQTRRKGVLSLVTASSDPGFHAGCFFLAANEISAGETKLSTETLPPVNLSRRFWEKRVETESGQVEILVLPINPPPALLICGAGIDALPVAELAITVGWDCIIVDHRSAFANPARFSAACKVQHLLPETLGKNIDLNQIDAVIIMSHNLGHDREYLAQVINADLAYIGLLGPRRRRDRLINEIGIDKASTPHIHGPAGLDIGAEMPESIALSIISEIHASLNQRHGAKLTPERG